MSTPLYTKLVQIWWDDIKFNDNWDDGGDGAVQPNECYTVGHVIEDSTTFLRIGSGYDYREDEWATIHAIPKGCITDMRVIYEPNEETE